MQVKKLAIVSLSSGVLGEDFTRHQVDRGLDRLESLGLQVVMMPNALKGMEYLKAQPQARAQDLLDAFLDPSIDMILCAIGGDDTYRLLPYLFDHNQLKHALTGKVFLGFSDTTVNHFMLYKLGLKTFYGQAFLTEICELDDSMLDYSAHYFKQLIEEGTIHQLTPSSQWYLEREDFSPKAIGTQTPALPDRGFISLQGSPQFRGEILGGCLESIYTFFSRDRYPDTVDMVRRYQIFPSLEEWQDKILFLETSEEKSSPEIFRKMIQALKGYGLFDVVAGVLLAKPQDEAYQEDYHRILLAEVEDGSLPIVGNLNVGHARPRGIIPLGVMAEVDVQEQIIRFRS